MPRLTEYNSYADALEHFSNRALWDLFDGDRAKLNIAHECIDRHASDPNRIAVRIAYDNGSSKAISFATIAKWSSRFAHYLEREGIATGDRVAIMLEPSLAFYVSLFGCMKRGAVAVPLFTLFGPEGARLRLDDCTPKILLTNREKADALGEVPGVRVLIEGDDLFTALESLPSQYACATGADDMAAFQYTSGTTRALPEAIRHTHRAVVLVCIAALYGTGVRPGDEFFCPSSPAWGHGMWHGTLAPLALGVTTGVYAGRFDADRLMQALQEFRVTNLSAAATHYRMMMNAGTASNYHFALEKLSYTGEPIDQETLGFVERTFGIPVCSMYGTTEVGVLLVNYPGAEDFTVKPGSLGKPVPKLEVQVQRADGSPTDANEIGEIQTAPARRMVSDQGSGLCGRRWLLLSRRARGRRHHLRGLDHERGGDRKCAARAPGDPRGGRHWRRRRDARPSRQSLLGD